jgi:hypothetical protein
MSMLREHEEGPEPDGDQKCACGRFWMGMNDRCGHCFSEEAHGEKCPVCQSPEIPPVFYDADMKNELRRLIAARKQWFAQHTQKA